MTDEDQISTEEAPAADTAAEAEPETVGEVPPEVPEAEAAESTAVVEDDEEPPAPKGFVAQTVRSRFEQ